MVRLCYIVRNRGNTAVVIIGFEFEDVAYIEKTGWVSATGLFGNGLSYDELTGEIRLNVGGEGFIILDLNGIMKEMTEGEKYTILIRTRDHGIFKAELTATYEKLNICNTFSFHEPCV